MKKVALVVCLLLIVLGVAQQAEDAQYLQMRRTACVILSRIHSNNEKTVIEEVIQGLQSDTQQRYINKIYIVAVEKCQSQITQQEVQSFYVDSEQFNPSALFPLLDGIDYRDIANDLTTSKEQDQITKFIKKFDQENQIREEERKAKKEQEEGVSESYEMKFLGLSIKDLPTGAKLAYVVIFAGIVIAAVVYGLSQLDKGNEKPSNKRRKSPKKDKAA